MTSLARPYSQVLLNEAMIFISVVQMDLGGRQFLLQMATETDPAQIKAATKLQMVFFEKWKRTLSAPTTYLSG